MGAQASSSLNQFWKAVPFPASSEAMVMYAMSDFQYQAVYNTLSFSLASMMATTMFLWFRSFAVKAQYQSAVLISGLVTFIAAYHYIRIFNSWVDAYAYARGSDAPTLTGVPFNDAYRYMDWLLTVPLLLIEILLVMNLSERDYSSKAWTLGVGSGADGDFVVHLPDRVPVPNARNQRCQVCCGHPDRLLHLGHHLEVRCWTRDLPDHVRQVQHAGPPPVNGGLEMGWSLLTETSIQHPIITRYTESSGVFVIRFSQRVGALSAPLD